MKRPRLGYRSQKIATALTMGDAAAIVVDCITRMARERMPLMQRVLRDPSIHIWNHYPDDDARDAFTQSRWYYHVHEPGDRDPREHGHFHLFLHKAQIDPAVAPIASPSSGDNAPAQMAHIAGLSIDRDGVPLAWFVTNRWVTDEFLYPVEQLIAHLDRYNVDRTAEDGLVNRFLTAMVALHRTEIASLLRERDAKLARLIAKHGPAAYESGNAVMAISPIDLDEKIASVDGAPDRSAFS